MRNEAIMAPAPRAGDTSHGGAASLIEVNNTKPGHAHREAQRSAQRPAAIGSARPWFHHGRRANKRTVTFAAKMQAPWYGVGET